MSEVYVPLEKPDVILPAEKSFWGAELATCVIARGEAHVLMLISGALGSAEVMNLPADPYAALKIASGWTQHMRGHMQGVEPGMDSPEWTLIEAYQWHNPQLQDRAADLAKGVL